MVGGDPAPPLEAVLRESGGKTALFSGFAHGAPALRHTSQVMWQALCRRAAERITAALESPEYGADHWLRATIPANSPRGHIADTAATDTEGGIAPLRVP
eukprot:gene12471-biopygen3342